MKNVHEKRVSCKVNITSFLKYITGSLIFLCGGESEVFELVKEHLEAMGKASYLLGEVGQGSRIKLVVSFYKYDFNRLINLSRFVLLLYTYTCVCNLQLCI